MDHPNGGVTGAVTVSTGRRARCFAAALVVGVMASGRAEPVPLAPLLPPEVMIHVDRALDALVMTREDAGFAKDHGRPAWTLSWITNALNDPWQLPGVAERIWSAVEAGDAPGWWSLATELMELPEVAATETVVTRRIIDADVDEEWSDLLDPFLAEMDQVQARLAEAYGGLSRDEQVRLAAGIFVSAFETEDHEAARGWLADAGIPRTVQAEVEAEGRKLDGTADALAWLDAARRVDRALVAEAGRLAYAAVWRLAEQAGRMDAWPTKPRSIETSLGRVIIGSPADDRHEGPALLVLDPGGDDLYLDGPGAANGLLNHPVAVVIDLSGDDRYDAAGLLGVGGALWGVAVVLDFDGDDTYRSRGPGLGAGCFGAGWLEDFSGSDTYRATAYAQGAGVVGYGFLIDHQGNDGYEVGFYGQGFSGVMGWGLLADRGGHDRYFAGNVRRDHERNDDRFLSLSQGFSIGLRPHAGGGVAALVDLAGNDTYTADIYGQGVSYYYAAGFLLDGAGHDRYSVYQYGQGCGIHMSLGLLADASGDDTYNGYILTQGAAHDYAVGMLFDHAGNDTYTADHHAQGRALNNAFALLVDREGEDAYFGRQREGTQGIGNEGGFRDYGSLALLLDLAGQDRYSGGFSNNAITLRPLYGVVYDHAAEANHE